MPKERTLEQYTETRAIIDNVRLVYRSKTKNPSTNQSNRIFIRVPDKIRRQLKLSTFNETDFRVIIVRKGKLKENETEQPKRI